VNRRSAYPILFLVLLLFYLREPLFRLQPYFGVDLFESVPARLWMADQLREGILPLWNPYHSSGTPMAADDFTWGIYYPGMIFHLLWPGFGFTLEAAAHLILSFYFFRKLLLHFRASPTAVLFGAVTFHFGACMTTLFYAGDINILYAACWIPAIFYYGSVFAAENRCALGLVIALTLQILCGHPEIVFFTAAFSFLYCFVLSPGRRLRLFGLFVLPLFLAAIHLLPIAEVFSSHSMRKQYWSSVSASDQSFPLEFLFSLVTPNLFGQQSSGTYWGPPFDYLLSKYIGLVPWLLVFYAVSRWKELKLPVRAMLVLMCVSLFIAFGKGSGFSQIADFIPVIRNFSVPANMMIYVAFFASVVGALHWKSLSEPAIQKAVFLLFLCSAIGFCFVYFDIFSFRESLAAVTLERKRQVALVQTFQTWIILLVLLVTLRSKHRRYFALGIQICCLVFYASSWIQSVNLKTYVSSEKWKIVNADGDLFRVFEHVSLPLVDKPVLKQDFSQGPSDGIYFHIFRLQGATTTLSLDRYHEYKAYLNFGHFPVQDRHFHLANIDSKLLNYSNVKYLISSIPIEDKLWSFVGKTSFYHYLYRDYHPRARIFHQFIVEPDPRKMLERMSLEDGLYLERKTSGMASGSTSSGTIQWLSYSPNKLDLETATEQPGYLFLSEIYYPGWRATIDGRPAEIERANYVFRAVALPSGKHRIRMWYRPNSWLIGLSVSMISLVLLVVLRKRL